jgi:predicted DNA-binding transcriptional regulator YafY
MNLISTLEGLLLEIASISDIEKSIRDKVVTQIYYDGDEPGGKGLRVIEPVCLGRSKSNNLVLRAWDTEGSSHTATTGEQPLPGWRLFRVDKIFTYKPTLDNFSEQRPGYNPDGDKSMNSVILNTKFN